ncbi:MAG TPA: PaaI family thioesterase [Pseudonocardiaceae bacterium]|jgi:uncharacterized protein (TIGR00369 family)
MADEVPHGARERTYKWDDPLQLAAAANTMTGLEFLTAIADGMLPPPPVMTTTGIRAVEFGDGRAVFELKPAEWQYNPIGSVHGGVLTTLADSALGCAVHTKLGIGRGYTSLEQKINFTRAVTVSSGPLRCVGEVITIGRRVATSEATITDHKGRVVGHASSTCLLMDKD